MVIDYPYAIEHKIRVIGYDDCKWYIDPPIEDIRSHWKLWVLAKQLLFRLDWDPIHVLSDRQDVLPIAFQY